MLPGEARQDWTGEARRIHFDHLIVAEVLIEAAAEMAARLHDHDSAPCRCRARMPQRTPDRHTGSGWRLPQRRCRPTAMSRTDRCRSCCWHKCHAGRARSHRAAADDRRDGMNDLENSSPPLRLKRAVKLAPSPSRCASADSARVMDHTHQGVLHAGCMKRLEDPHRVAPTAAARIVGDVGEDQRGAGVVRRAPGSRVASSARSAPHGTGSAGPSQPRRSRAPAPSPRRHRLR